MRVELLNGMKDDGVDWKENVLGHYIGRRNGKIVCVIKRHGQYWKLRMHNKGRPIERVFNDVESLMRYASLHMERE
jgi:hypothetical protein